MLPSNTKAAEAPRPRLAVILALAAAGLLCAAPGRAQLAEYIKRPDPAFAWRLNTSRPASPTQAYTAHNLTLTSQRWRDNEWKHAMTIIQPEKLEVPDTAIILVTGGSNGPSGEPDAKPSTESLLLAQIAVQLKTVAVVLQQVPNEPILDGRSEDAAIAYTFDQYLKTGEQDWPLLFPMVKSAVRAMDAAEAAVKEKSGVEIKRWFVTGASKRGWTTWLTGVADPRVIGIAPMVIDNLNMAQQMPHQMKSWGAYSRMIDDYTALNLPQRSSDPDVARLLLCVDPYGYLDKLKMPKLMVNGTNDPYWVLDANQFYFDGLKGEKFVHYVPNAGHGLGAGAAEAIGGFYWMVRKGIARPNIQWQIADGERSAHLKLRVDKAPKEARLWQATSAPDRDFRDAQWTSTAAPPASEGRYEMEIAKPAEGYAAFYAELVYPTDFGKDFGLCTTARIIGAGEKLEYAASSAAGQ